MLFQYYVNKYDFVMKFLLQIDAIRDIKVYLRSFHNVNDFLPKQTLEKCVFHD